MTHYYLLPFFFVFFSISLQHAHAGTPSDWPSTWTTFPHSTPSNSWPDGPFVGNGNEGFAIGGAPGSINLYGTVHGFWSNSLGKNSTMPPLNDFNNDSGDANVNDGSGFPSCPGPTCNITVGLTLMRLLISSPEVTTSWTATLDLARATSTITLGGASGASLVAVLYASATSQVSILEIRNTGTITLPSVNVTIATNGNIQGVPIAAGCLDVTDNLVKCPSLLAINVTAAITKDANTQAAQSSFPITAAAACRIVTTSGGFVPSVMQDYADEESAASWVTNSKVMTETIGVTSLFSLAPGASITYALSMAASRDPGVVGVCTPSAAVAARVNAVNASALVPLRTAHESWWNDFFSRSSVSLEGEEETEAFWYTSLYALGSGTRAGQLVMDLWSPWRTTDYSLWRSNPTMDYNQQALYSGVIASNHVDLSFPFYDMIDQAVAGGSPAAESAALNCSGGLHLSVDLAPLGLKLGVYGDPQAWGIRSNAVYAGVLYSYHWAAVDQSDPSVLAWVNAQAFPYLDGVIKFWACYLTKVNVPDAPDGYRYWSIGDCDGDEDCNGNYSPEQITNPTWTITYLQRALETVTSMAIATGKPLDKSWADILAHLPPTPTTTHMGMPTLSAYGEGALDQNVTAANSFRGQAGYLHALWPGETFSPLSESNATLVAAALNTFNFTAWTQDNSFSWMYSSAARAGVAPDTILRRWRAELISNLKTNHLVSFGGLCSDSLGAVAFIHDMLIHSQEGFLRLFPAWPGNASASFTTLRMRGALLVSAAYIGQAQWAGAVAGRTGGTVNFTVFAEAEGIVRVLSPWPTAPVNDVSVIDTMGGGGSVQLNWSVVNGTSGGPLGSWGGVKGHTYVMTCKGNSCTK